MRYLSVCSGIEAASVAWQGFGWQPVGFSEIEKNPSRVLAHHYGSNLPDEDPTHNGVPNFGDFTKIPLDTLGQVDLLVGGTPCQAFSVAGLRGSLGDARGNLTLAYTVLAHELARSHGLRCALWENVPGVLSTKDNAFGCFLSGLVGGDNPLNLPKGIERWPDAGMVAGPRARVAWRVLDAQYFGLAQRRRRVFVVASFRDGFDPAAVLFERKGLRRNPPTRGEAGQDFAGYAASSIGSYSPISGAGGTLRAHGGDYGGGTENLIADMACVTGDITHTLKAEGFDASEDGTGRGNPIVPHVADTLTSNGDAHSGYRDEKGLIATPVTIPLGTDLYNGSITGDVAATMGTRGSSENASGPTVMQHMSVRRLTPRECERLQGFPDDHTACLVADGPRYKALGNSMAVPVMRWIGERIKAEASK